MPKIINTFLKGKLNKDLDARLVPNGEYRDARNVQVSRSEGPNVGSLENVLGNEVAVNLQTLTSTANLFCIGSLADETNNCVYLFLTDYTDPNPSRLTYSAAAENFIIRYDAFTNSSLILVKGPFLNFSKTHQITAVNLLEDLLFWTDNRNQPRKINVQTAISVGSSHYQTEDQISVSKYNPYRSIQLYQESSSAGEYETTMKDVTSKFLPTGGTALVNDAGNFPGGTPVAIDNLNANFPLVGQPISYINNGVMTTTGRTVAVGTTTTSLAASGSLPAMDDNTELVFEPNPYYDNTFAGDPDYLEDRFVRFSYRFRFEDNEYSLFAPFTQIAFIPKQDGYFMYIKDANTNYEITDQSSTYRSTVVSFMENKVDDIKLYIPLPFSKSDLKDSLKIKEMDILYKESDGVAVKVIDTIKISDISSQSGDADFYTYDYISKKPIKTLPSDELTRTYDKIPVRALAQEISSNRIIYGNYQTKHTPPATIDYNVAVSDKFPFELSIATATTNATTTDSDVLFFASTTGISIGDFVTGTGITFERIVTLVSPTQIKLNGNVTVANGTTLTFAPSPDEQTTSKVEYPNSSVKQNRNYQVGVIFSDRYGRQSSVILSNNTTLSTLGNSSFIGDTIYSAYFSEAATQGSWPGNSIKMLFNNPIGPQKPNTVTLWPGIYNGDSSDNGYNPLGWYSYKIVVKQQEQEYYNVYLPGIMASYPDNTTLEVSNTSHAVLINDNINKVPRDLTEVGPDQKQFRSSVRLFGRIQNTSTAPTYVASKTTFDNLGSLNIQYYPGRSSDTVSTISTIRDLFDYDPSDPPKPNLFPQFYLLDSNPLIARISTNNKIGQLSTINYTTVSAYIVTGDNYDANTNVSVASYTGVISADMVVYGDGIPEKTYVTNVTGPSGSNPSVYTLQFNNPITVSDNTNISLVAGFAAPNAGEDKIPGIQFLSVYETEPVESALDIYWETSTSGLLSDLNNAILNSNSGGAGFSSFDVGGWTEGIVSGANILTGNFTIIDNFGVNIPTANITSLTLTSVVDDTGSDRTSYFTLTNPSTGFFNIQTTSAYYNNIFFSDNSNIRSFTFSFEGVVTNSGTATTTNYVEGPFGPANVQPEITLPATTSTIVNTTRITTSTLQTLEGHNGANNDDLKTSDLTASITAVQDTTNSVDVLSENYFALSTSAIGSPTYRLRGLLTKPSTTLPVADYTVVVTYEDAIETADHTINVKMNSTSYLVATYPKLLYRTCDDEGIEIALPWAVFEISSHPVAANNGYYLYYPGIQDGANVLNSITSNDGFSNIITLDRTNATTSGSGQGGDEVLYFSSIGWAEVLALGLANNEINCDGTKGWCGAPVGPSACNSASNNPSPGSISIPNTLIEII